MGLLMRCLLNFRTFTIKLFRSNFTPVINTNCFLSQPVYGLIFLFRYREEEDVDMDVPECPKHVWFANQVCVVDLYVNQADLLEKTINNACATIALLNIIMNVPGLYIGNSLENFKVETQKLKPPYRGQRLGQNDFIRNIHNSFAR